MSRRPGYRDTSQNWDDPTADAVLGEEPTVAVQRDITVDDLQHLTARMREILVVLAETGSATRTAHILGISRDRVYVTKEFAAKRIMRLKEKNNEG